MKYCEECGSNYTDRIDFCFREGSILREKLSAEDVPTPSNLFGDISDRIETSSIPIPEEGEQIETALTTEEFLRVPPKTAGHTPLSALWIAPPPSIGATAVPADEDFSFERFDSEDARTEIDARSPLHTTATDEKDTAKKRPVSGKKRTATSRYLLPLALISSAAVATITVGALMFAGADDTVMDSPNDAKTVVSTTAPVPDAAPVPKAAPVPEPVVEPEVVLELTTDGLDNEMVDDGQVPLEAEDDLRTAELEPDPTKETVPPVAKPKPVVKRPKKARKTAPVEAPTPAAPTATIDPLSPWGDVADVPIATVASISVVSDPLGAMVSINGVERGITPLKLLGLEFGTYTVSVDLKGYLPKQLVLPIKAATPAPINFTLEPTARTGKVLVVVTGRQGGILFMDGLQKGPLPAMVQNVTEGRHTFEVQHEAGTISSTEDISFGQAGVLKIDLGKYTTSD